jgi:hypothetical protein
VQLRGIEGMPNGRAFKAFFSHTPIDARADPKLVEALTTTLEDRINARFVNDSFEIWRGRVERRSLLSTRAQATGLNANPARFTFTPNPNAAFPLRRPAQSRSLGAKGLHREAPERGLWA